MLFSSTRAYLLVLNNVLKGSQNKGWLGRLSAVLFMGFLEEDDKTKLAREGGGARAGARVGGARFHAH